MGIGDLFQSKDKTPVVKEELKMIERGIEIEGAEYLGRDGVETRGGAGWNSSEQP